MPGFGQQGQEEDFYNYITDTIRATNKQLEESRKQCESQATLWNWSAWIAAIIGLLIFFILLIIIIVQKDTAGWFKPLAGLIFDAVAAMFFTRADKANERVDKIQIQLDETEKILLAIKLVMIADSETQKRYHEKFIERLLALPAPESETKRTRSLERKTKKS